MLWGKTLHERLIARDKKRNRIWFAWRPVQLNNGRWIWWVNVKREYQSGEDSGKYVYWSI